MKNHFGENLTLALFSKKVLFCFAEAGDATKKRLFLHEFSRAFRVLTSSHEFSRVLTSSHEFSEMMCSKTNTRIEMTLSNSKKYDRIVWKIQSP
jgi:hypothetical protein